MTAKSQIVAGGGWRGTRSERVKVKAWSTFFGAIGLAVLALLAGDSISPYSWIPAGLSFLTSLFFFVHERPRELWFPSGHARHDLRNLYGASDGARAIEDRDSAG